MTAYPFVTAYRAWQDAAEAEKAARMSFRVAVSDARDEGAKLDEIAAQLGVTRQAVQKVLRELYKAQDQAEAEAAYVDRMARRDEREHLRGLGFTTRDRQCSNPKCRRLKSRPSDVCFYCGDDPVVNAGGDPDRFDRMNHDASYAGGIR